MEVPMCLQGTCLVCIRCNNSNSTKKPSLPGLEPGLIVTNTSATLQPLSGKFYTYLNAKQTFLFFVLIFEIGSLLCAVSTSSTFFILGRAIAGMGSSGLENGALTLVAGAVPLHKRPRKSRTR